MRALRRLLTGAVLLMLLATAAEAAVPDVVRSSHDYGPVRGNHIDLYRPEGKGPVPLILFVHGGGWSAGSKAMGEGSQPAHFVSEGYAWAAMNYRLVPQATVEDQAADVARAIGWLVKHARRLHLDPGRVILIGHSSGAHLVALVATDPQWLKAAGVPFDTIKGVISLDGAGLDVPGIIAKGASTSPFYAGAFGIDVERQTRLSPFAHVGAPDAPRWLLFYDQDHNAVAGYFATRFAEALKTAGAGAQVEPIGGTTHMRMLGELGKPDDATTGAIDRFLGVP